MAGLKSVDLNAGYLLMLEIHFSNKLKCANYSNQISETFLWHIYLIQAVAVFQHVMWSDNNCFGVWLEYFAIIQVPSTSLSSLTFQ